MQFGEATLREAEHGPVSDGQPGAAVGVRNERVNVKGGESAGRRQGIMPTRS